MSQLHLRLENVSSHFPADWQIKYVFMALEINGRCRVLDELAKWKRMHRDDYKKILKVAKLAGFYRPVPGRNHVKEDHAGSGVYEMRAHKGSARLFFMYGPRPPWVSGDHDGVVIFLDTYWKAKDSSDEQNRAFEKCRNMKQVVDENLQAIYAACWEQPEG